MMNFDGGFYLKVVLKCEKSTQTEESVLSILEKNNSVNEEAKLQVKFLNIDYEYMEVQNKRFLTFERFEGKVTPEHALELAREGFFSVNNTLIQCNYCLQVFEDWENWDDVTDEHEERVPWCPLVRRCEVENVVPSYHKLKDVPYKVFCGLYGPEDYVHPNMKGFQLGEDDDKN